MTISKDPELLVQLYKEKALLMKRIEKVEDLQKKIKNKSLESLDRKVKAELIRMGLDEIASGLTSERVSRSCGEDWLFCYTTIKYTLRIQHNGDCFYADLNFKHDHPFDMFASWDKELHECLMGLYKNLIQQKRDRKQDIEERLSNLREVQEAYDIFDKNLKEEFR